MFYKTSLYLLLLIASQALSGSVDYCLHVKNCNHLRNIVCQRKQECEPLEKCTKVELKRSTKIYIMLSINEYRNDVALGNVKDFPNAADMVTQYWEEDLEYVTSCAQNMCQKQDEVCANTVKFSQTITLQNVLLLKDVRGEVDFFEKTIKSWTNPMEFTSAQISQYTDLLSVNYAAVLWCNSPAIGCALSHDSNFYYGACTFSIAPKYGEHVYREGDPCSGCPKGLECNEEYHGLCGEIMLPRANKGDIVICEFFLLNVAVLRAFIVLLG